MTVINKERVCVWCNRIFIGGQCVCPRCRYRNKVAPKIEARAMKKVAWAQVRDRIHAEMTLLIKDDLDPATVTIEQMQTYGFMF